MIGVTVDPDNETADVNSDNNSWPKKKSTSDFEKFKELKSVNLSYAVFASSLALIWFFK